MFYLTSSDSWEPPSASILPLERDGEPPNTSVLPLVTVVATKYLCLTSVDSKEPPRCTFLPLVTVGSHQVPLSYL